MEFFKSKFLKYLLLSAVLFLVSALTRHVQGLSVLEGNDTYFFMVLIPTTLIGGLIINHFSDSEKASEFFNVHSGSSLQNSKRREFHDKLCCPGSDTELQMSNCVEYNKDSVVLTYNLSISKAKIGISSPLTQHKSNRRTSSHDTNTGVCEVSEPQQGEVLGNSQVTNLCGTTNEYRSKALNSGEPAPHQKKPSQDSKGTRSSLGNVAQSTKPEISDYPVSARLRKKEFTNLDELVSHFGTESTLKNEPQGIAPESEQPVSLSHSSPIKIKRKKKLFPLWGRRMRLFKPHSKSKKKGKESSDKRDHLSKEQLKSPVKLNITNPLGEIQRTDLKEMADVLKQAISISKSLSFDQRYPYPVDKGLDNFKFPNFGRNEKEFFHPVVQRDGIKLPDPGFPLLYESPFLGQIGRPRQASLNTEAYSPRQSLDFVQELKDKWPLKAQSPESEVTESAKGFKWKSGLVSRCNSESQETSAIDMKHTGAIPKDKFVFHGNLTNDSSGSSCECLAEKSGIVTPENTQDSLHYIQEQHSRSRQHGTVKKHRRRRPSSPCNIPNPIGRLLAFPNEEDADQRNGSNCQQMGEADVPMGAAAAAASYESVER